MQQMPRLSCASRTENGLAEGGSGRLIMMSNVRWPEGMRSGRSGRGQRLGIVRRVPGILAGNEAEGLVRTRQIVWCRQLRSRPCQGCFGGRAMVMQGGPDIVLAGLWGQSRQPEEGQGDRVRQRLQDRGIRTNAYSRRCPRGLPQTRGSGAGQTVPVMCQVPVLRSCAMKVIRVS